MQDPSRSKKLLILFLASLVFLLPVGFLYFKYIRFNVLDYYQFSVTTSGRSQLLEQQKTEKIIGVLQRSYLSTHNSDYNYSDSYSGRVDISARSKTGAVIAQFAYWPSRKVIVKKEKVNSGSNVLSDSAFESSE